MYTKSRQGLGLGVALSLCAMCLLFMLTGVALAEEPLTPVQSLGSALYFDQNLSNPFGQSCADCHLPETGFVDPDSDLPVSEGVIPGLFGGRNSPMSSYAMYSPTRFFDEDEGLWIGGQFWDSRASGDFLGDPLADQAIGPFLNPVEMANSDMSEVVADAQSGEYGELFLEVCNSGITVNLADPAAVEAAYYCIGRSIATFERTGLFAQFDSKYDHYLMLCLGLEGDPDDCAKGIGKKAKKAGDLVFSAREWRGLQLFMGENDNNGVRGPGEGAMCAACHVADWTLQEDYVNPVVAPDWAPAGMVPPVFTDFTYDNLGVPKNPEIEDLIGEPQSADLGLGPVVQDENENGKFKVMTLRHIGATAPYTHNGLFKTLDELVHFYSSRDVPGSGPGGADWPAAEVPETVNGDELGNLGLSARDEADLTAFLKTLTDGYEPDGGCFIESVL